MLSGLRPTFVAPELDPELGIAHCLTPEALDEALAPSRTPSRRCSSRRPTSGPSPTSPALAEVAHDRDVPLVVDEAWGAHLRFYAGPAAGRALECGADLVLSSVRTRSSAASPSRRSCTSATASLIDEDVVDRCVTLIESTSPSALLTASLDAARRQRRGARRGAARRDDRGAGEDARARSARSPASTSSTSGSSGAPASPPGTRCGSRSTSAAPARTGTGSPR